MYFSFTVSEGQTRKLLRKFPCTEIEMRTQFHQDGWNSRNFARTINRGTTIFCDNNTVHFLKFNKKDRIKSLRNFLYRITDMISPRNYKSERFRQTFTSLLFPTLFILFTLYYQQLILHLTKSVHVC